MTGVGAYFGAQCQKHGMLVRVAGDNIMMSPPFIITPEEVDEVGLFTIAACYYCYYDSVQLYRYCLFWAEGVFTVLKHCLMIS